jgi:hypothetical protein
LSLHLASNCFWAALAAFSFRFSGSGGSNCSRKRPVASNTSKYIPLKA